MRKDCRICYLSASRCILDDQRRVEWGQVAETLGFDGQLNYSNLVRTVRQLVILGPEVSDLYAEDSRVVYKDFSHAKKGAGKLTSIRHGVLLRNSRTGTKKILNGKPATPCTRPRTPSFQRCCFSTTGCRLVGIDPCRTGAGGENFQPAHTSSTPAQGPQ